MVIGSRGENMQVGWFFSEAFRALIAAFYWFRIQKWPLDYSFDLVAPYILLGTPLDGGMLLERLLLRY